MNGQLYFSRRTLFFSSRRRHTRSYGVWSSDVCASDLGLSALFVGLGGLVGGTGGLVAFLLIAVGFNFVMFWFSDRIALKTSRARPVDEREAPDLYARSEERRVGKEGRYGGWRCVRNTK